jgi:hypothetical protein
VRGLRAILRTKHEKLAIFLRANVANPIAITASFASATLTSVIKVLLETNELKASIIF